VSVAADSPKGLQPLVLEYRGRRVLEIQFNGRRCWILLHLEEAMGYAKGALKALMLQDWAKECQAGKHFDTLRGERLKVLRALLKELGKSDLLSSSSPSILVVYEEGLDLILLKTERPIGVELRAVLVDHKVLKQLRETGTATLPGALPPASAPSLTSADLEALASVVLAKLQPALREVQAAAAPAILLDAKFRRANVASRVKTCVGLAQQIDTARSASSYTTTFYNLLRGVAGFGVMGCRWDLAPLDTYLRAVAALDGFVTVLRKLVAGQRTSDGKPQLELLLSPKHDERPPTQPGAGDAPGTKDGGAP
jgi:hypothetical protein